MAWSLVSKYPFDINGGSVVVTVGDSVDGVVFSLGTNCVFVYGDI